MKVFADFHHDDLYHSLHLLFEKRLGWELYSPVGMDWYTKGYWAYSTEPRVVQQYLGAGRTWIEKDDHCLVENPCHNRQLKAVTFDQFKTHKFDIVLASVPEHAVMYDKLVREYQSRAKRIQHVGNDWKKFNWSICRNMMISTAPFTMPEDINVVFYHQEFDLNLFNFEPGDPKGPIQSFVNDLPGLKDMPLFERYEKYLNDWKWYSYGLGCRDGNVRPLTKLVKTMKDSSFIFHAKSLGDGFGHIIHNLFALGRPGLIRGHYYKGKAASDLIIDGITCIDLDKHSFNENLALIKEAAREENYAMMSRRARQQFDNIVNYDEEEKKIREFLGNLQ